MISDEEQKMEIYYVAQACYRKRQSKNSSHLCGIDMSFRFK
jgi:hypothetical protein